MQLSIATTDAKQAWWPALFSVIAAVHSSLTLGYAYGYTSTALEQLSELPDGYAFRLGSISADLFVVSLAMYKLQVHDSGIKHKLSDLCRQRNPFSLLLSPVLYTSISLLLLL